MRKEKGNAKVKRSDREDEGERKRMRKKETGKGNGKSTVGEVKKNGKGEVKCKKRKITGREGKGC